MPFYLEGGGGKSEALCLFIAVTTVNEREKTPILVFEPITYFTRIISLLMFH